MTSSIERTLYDRSFEDNPVYRRIFTRLPHHVAHSFSRDQLEALYWASATQRAEHSMALRRRIRLPGRSVYLALFVGVDRRRKLSAIDRFVLNGLRHPRWRVVLLFTAAVLASVVLAAIALVALYVVKSAIGVDLTEGPSILHDLLPRAAGDGAE